MDDTGRGQQSEHVYLPYLCRKSIYGARYREVAGMPDTIAIAGAFPKAPLRATTTRGTRAWALDPLARGRSGTPMAQTACEFEGFCGARLLRAVAANEHTFMTAAGQSAVGVRGGAGGAKHPLGFGRESNSRRFLWCVGGWATENRTQPAAQECPRTRPGHHFFGVGVGHTLPKTSSLDLP